MRQRTRATVYEMVHDQKDKMNNGLENHGLGAM